VKQPLPPRMSRTKARERRSSFRTAVSTSTHLRTQLMNGSIDKAAVASAFQVIFGLHMVALLLYFRGLSLPTRSTKIIHFGGPWTPFTRASREMYPPVRPGFARCAIATGAAYGIMFVLLDLIW
jgi:hypothetical protein